LTITLRIFWCIFHFAVDLAEVALRRGRYIVKMVWRLLVQGTLESKQAKSLMQKCSKLQIVAAFSSTR
jgi:hypothetical protein